MITVIQIKFVSSRYSVQVLNSETKAFVHVEENLKLFNDVIEGVFSFKSDSDGRKIMTYKSTSMHRFSIVFAYFHKNAWRLRLRLVVTTNNGVKAFPMTKTLYLEDGRVEIPREFKTNSVLFIGLHSDTENIETAVRVHANSSGCNILNDGIFTGHVGTIEWNRDNDMIIFPAIFNACNTGKCFFDKRLYRRSSEQCQVASLQQQRFVPEPTMHIIAHEAEPIVKANPIVETGTVELQAPTLDSENEEPTYNAFQYWNMKAGDLIEPVLAGLNAVSSDGGKGDIDETPEKSEYNDFQFWTGQLETMTKPDAMKQLDSMKEPDEPVTIQLKPSKLEVVSGTFYQKWHISDMMPKRDTITKLRESGLIHSDTSEE